MQHFLQGGLVTIPLLKGIKYFRYDEVLEMKATIPLYTGQATWKVAALPHRLCALDTHCSLCRATFHLSYVYLNIGKGGTLQGPAH
jgi:hypothetical protein